MKTLLLSLLIFSQPLLAAPEVGAFGPADASPYLSVDFYDGKPRLIFSRHPLSGISTYDLTTIEGEDSKDAKVSKLTKEDFEKCYLLASRAIREFRRILPENPSTDPHFRTVRIANGEAESIQISFELDALPENPRLQELLAFLDSFTKEPAPSTKPSPSPSTPKPDHP